MPDIPTKPYTGNVQAVILDWAGTAIDCGCRGPAAVFQRAFQLFGIEPSMEEIRAPMGREKREHVRIMLEMPEIARQWQQKYEALPLTSDVDNVFVSVQELMAPTLADYSEPVPGCIETMAILRSRGIKIGSCTGYRRSMMTELLPRAIEAGYNPDCIVTADEVPAGRPWPWMCWLNCVRLAVFPLEAAIKVGDTVADIEEGLNAGHWSVAITRTSNLIGLSTSELEQLAPPELAAKEAALADKFYAAGAHYVISSIKELPNVCDLVNQCLARGEKPHKIKA